jgi:hypothetical protein
VTLSNEVECDEAYVIAGHKGQPEVVKNKGRKGRRRRLKGKFGRGTLEKDRPPVFGTIQRGGQVVINRMNQKVGEVWGTEGKKEPIRICVLVHPFVSSPGFFQSPWTALPQLLSPPQQLFRFCNRKGKFFSRLGQNMWHKREVGVVALCLVGFFLAHHMQNIKSKVCRNRSSEIVSGVKAGAHLPS